ncbi:hypothetical protein PVAG01_02826 [Phlyctema vagabunda]|uniref:DUF4385 domain containing protein n=1 Tax=Phlyctema vagabunda TaxID=108571 RepID=A0ABR4PS01_9HELO
MRKQEGTTEEGEEMKTPPAFTPPSKAHRMRYRIGRGETGVLSYEPYKTHLLGLWRFRSAAIAQTSSAQLWDEFLRFHAARDFVGMDMARKFVQMGMTRAQRYANYAGGRKYVDGRQKAKSQGHAGKEEKEAASRIFRLVWDRCRAHEGYASLKAEFLAEQKEWRALHKGGEDVEETEHMAKVKKEEKEESEGGERSEERIKKRRTVRSKREEKPRERKAKSENEND